MCKFPSIYLFVLFPLSWLVSLVNYVKNRRKSKIIDSVKQSNKTGLKQWLWFCCSVMYMRHLLYAYPSWERDLSSWGFFPPFFPWLKVILSPYGKFFLTRNEGVSKEDVARCTDHKTHWGNVTVIWGHYKQNVFDLIWISKTATYWTQDTIHTHRIITNNNTKQSAWCHSQVDGIHLWVIQRVDGLLLPRYQVKSNDFALDMTPESTIQ